MPRGRLLETALVLFLVAAAAGGYADAPAQDYADEALKRALVTFAVARTLNGVISVVQATELALEPGGVGVTLLPGEILDPVNDLIERFSWVMLASSASLGLQSMLARISAWWGVTALLAGTALLALVSTWLGARLPAWWRPLALRLLVALAFLRFAVPVLLLATHLVSAQFLQAEAEEATERLRQTSGEVRALGEAPDSGAATPAEKSLAEKFSEFLDERLASIDVERRVGELRERVAHVPETVIDLIVVFTLETILVPLAFLWVLARLLAGLMRSIGGPGR